MKKIYILLAITLLTFFNINVSFGQLQAFTLGARNFQYGDTLGGIHNQLFFEIYLVHTNPEVSGPFHYGLGQYGLTFNPSIANGGTLSFRILGSELPVEERPPTSQVAGNELKLSGNIPVPPGTVIGTDFPGTKIVRVRLRTTALSFADVPLKLKWSTNVSPPPYRVGLAAFLPESPLITEITGNGNFYIDSTNSQNYLDLVNPGALSVNNSSTINFTWKKYDPAVNYTLKVSDDPAMSQLIVNDSLLTDTFKTKTNFNFDRTYYWMVVARDSLNNFTSSFIRKFSTTPFQMFPKNDSSDTPLALNFVWRKIKNKISHYTLKISTDSLQSSIIFLDSAITDTFKTEGGFLMNRKYYWSVSATDSSGNTERSAVWNFKTVVPEIHLLSPPNNSVNLQPRINFNWNMVFDYPVNYTLKISGDSLQNQIVYIDSSITDTFKTYSGLDLDKKYFWSVTVTDSFGISYRSAVWNLKTMPVLVSPADHSADLPLSINFTWQKVFDPGSYTLQIAKDSGFSQIIISDSALTDTSRSVSGLNFNGKYYWKVLVRDSFNITYATAVRTFSTMSSLISPDDNASNIYISSRFAWHRFFNYNTTYSLKISSDSAQSIIIYQDTAVSDTSKIVSGLNFDRHYFWSVSARDSSNDLVASEIRNFYSSTFLIYPINNGTYSGNVYFTWHKMQNATKYLLEVSPSADFGFLVYNNANLTDTSILLYLTTEYDHYFWRVSARDLSGYFYTSPVWIFHKDFPVPIELSGFTYSLNKNNVRLDWTTAAEQNNSGFDVERQLVKNGSAEEWIRTGFVKGAGNSNTTTTYTFSDNNLTSGKYRYRLKQSDFNGNFRYYDLSDEVDVGIPVKTDLSQNFPNPFNPITVISYQCSMSGFVSLKIYDMSGKEVAVLVNEKQEAGFYSVKFHGSDLSSGVYFYKLEAAGIVQTRRMLLVK